MVQLLKSSLAIAQGHTYESVGIRAEQMMVLHFEPANRDLQPEMVTA